MAYAPPDGSLAMVDCELYSLPADTLDADISPYACFYRTGKPLVKAGWLDKLSPQGWVNPFLSVVVS